MARSLGKKPLRPEIWNVLLASVDGSLASHSLESTASRRASGVVPEIDFERMKVIVAQCDAVIMGARSLAVERGAFRVGNLRSKGEPLWVIFTGSGNLDPNHPFWRQKGIPRAICFCSDFDDTLDDSLHTETRDMMGSPCEFLVGSLKAVLTDFVERGFKRVALLGGGEINAHFWRAGVVDRLFLTVSPWLLGGTVHLLSGPQLGAPVPLRLEKCEQEGDLLFLEYGRRPRLSLVVDD